MKIFNIDRLLESLTGYLETKIELFRLDLEDEIQKVIAKAIILVIVVICVFFALFFRHGFQTARRALEGEVTHLFRAHFHHVVGRYSFAVNGSVFWCVIFGRCKS